MYDLGSNFKFDLNKSSVNPKCVFKGDKYRITVLTERLVRLEYNENGMFEDFPTELIWYRNFKKPNFTFLETKKALTIKTNYFELFYKKGKKFSGGKISPANNLKISLLNTDKVWYYKHPEIRNYGATAYKLKNEKNKRLQKSLYSLDGFATIDDSKSSLILDNGSFKKRDNSGIDLYVFLYNKDFYYCLSDYFLLTGNPPLIPRYALGIWWDKNIFYKENELVELTQNFKENNIPISMFVLNKWQINNEYKFNEYYNNPENVIKYLNNCNIRVGLSLNDPVEFTSSNINFEILKEYLQTDKNGNIPFNVYDAKTIDAYIKLLIHPLNNIGIDFYFFNAFDRKKLDRLMILKHYLYYDNINKRPLVVGYNSTIAAHRYPVLYAGEANVSWDSLKSIPTFNSSSSNIGVCFWSHDIGGTNGGIEDEELFIRYIELGVFSSILRLGSDSSKYYKREPWKWGIKTYEITSRYLQLRYKLIPYIYTESYKYYKYGKSLIEPIYYTCPKLYDDPLYSNEYYFGNSFLISPIITKKDSIMNRTIHKLYIPDGTWYDYFTGKKYSGNKKYVSFYKEEEYPVFVKEGTIIPISYNEYNDISAPKKMGIEVFPGASNTYSIYEDDGYTNDYKLGEYLITNVEFLYQSSNYKLSVFPVAGKKGVIREKRDYEIKFKNTSFPSSVMTYVGGKVVKHNAYTVGNDLIIEVLNVSTDLQLTVLCGGENIEIEAIRIINEDIESIISDLPIKTILKDKIDSIIFSNELDLKKKRIAIKRMANGKNYLDRKYIDLFMKLLEYLNEV